MFYLFYQAQEAKEEEYRDDLRAAEIARLLKGTCPRQKSQPFRQIAKLLLQLLERLLLHPANRLERLGPENDMTQQPKTA